MPWPHATNHPARRRTAAGDSVRSCGASSEQERQSMELQQIGLRHPAAELVRNIQRNRTGIPRRMFIAEGLYEHNIVLAAGVRLDTFLWCPEAAYSDEAKTRSAELAARAARAYRISARTLERLAERPSPDGLLSIAQLPDWSPAQIELGDQSLILVADGIEIPGNLGTLIRTMDACAADCLVLTNRRTRLTHPKVLRASQGMSIRVPALDFDKVADAAARTALVVGSERYGISPDWYQAGFSRVGIPMLGAADSLNVAISASVLLYEARARKNGW